MDRKEFLRNAGGLALATLAPNSIARSNEASTAAATQAVVPDCTLSPSVPEGPYYLDANQVRKDITEKKSGAPVEYRITILDAKCLPVANAMVDIWQCDTIGIYSGFGGQKNGTSTIGQTFLRGIQTTDANGEVRFTSIYPGWYPRRLTHLHVKIHLQSKTLVTTNLFYPDNINAEVYAKPEYTLGPNLTTVAQDIELRGDSARLKTLTFKFTKDSNGLYIGSYTFGIAAQPVSLSPAQAAVKGQFHLKKNFPNPVVQLTTFTFSLLQSSRVCLEIMDGQGQRRDRVLESVMGAGEHKVVWDRSKPNLPAGLFFYRLTVENAEGIFSRTLELLLE